MFRKITRTGTALTMSLPAKWAKHKGLKAGDEIDVEEAGDKLIVSVKVMRDRGEVSIPFNDVLFSDMLEELYLDDVSRIIVKGENLPKLDHYVSKFLGMSIIEEDEDKVIIEKTLRPLIQSSKAIIRRCMLLTREGLKENPPEFSDDIGKMLMLSESYEKGNKQIFLLKRFYEIMCEIKTTMYDDAFSTIRILFDIAYNQKYNFSVKAAREFDSLVKRRDELFKKYHGKEDTVLLSKLYVAFDMVYLLHKDIIREKGLDSLESKDKKKRFEVGVCVKEHSNPYWGEEFWSAVQDASEKHKDIDTDIRAPFVDYDIKEQEEILEGFINKGVDCIILAPIHPKKLKKVIKKINEAEIPLIVVDTDLGLKEGYKFIGFDNYKGGYITGEYANKFLKDNSKVLVVEGEREGNFRQRVDGFKDACKAKISVVTGHFRESVAYRKVFEHMNKKKFDAIFSASDVMTKGAIKAVKELGIKVPIFGFDYTEDGKEALKKKEIKSTVDTKPKKMAELAVEVTSDLLHGNTVADKIEYDLELRTY